LGWGNQASSREVSLKVCGSEENSVIFLDKRIIVGAQNSAECEETVKKSNLQQKECVIATGRELKTTPGGFAFQKKKKDERMRGAADAQGIQKKEGPGGGFHGFAVQKRGPQIWGPTLINFEKKTVPQKGE